MDSSSIIHKRILETKWTALGARGLVRPRDEGEKQRRLLEASVGRQGNVSSVGGETSVAVGLKPLV